MRQVINMEKRVSALKARQNLGQVMNEVALRGDDYIIERAGKPLVAVISMEKYALLEGRRKEALDALNLIWEKIGGEDPEMIEKTIDEAVQSVRKK